MFMLTGHSGFIPQKTIPVTKQVFSTSTTGQTINVPLGVRTIRVKAWGAGGGGGGGGGLAGGNGASGGYIESELTVVPGEELVIRVGGSGQGSPVDSFGVGGINGGGNGGNQAITASNLVTGGAGGGGYSGIFRQGNPILIAGGGGGGGGGDGGTAGMTVDTGGNGGMGGGLSGVPGRTGVTITNISNNPALNLEYYAVGTGETSKSVDFIRTWTGGFLSGQTSTLNVATITTNLGVPDEKYGLILTGILYIPNPTGTVDFTLKSDDGSKLFIDDILVIDNDGLHAPVTVSGSIFLEACIHRIEIQFFENTGRSLLEVQIRLPGDTKYSELLASNLVAPSFADLDPQLYEAGGGGPSSGGVAAVGLTQSVQPTSGTFLQGGTGGTGIPSERPGGGGGGGGLYGGAGGLGADFANSSGSGGGGGSSFSAGKIITTQNGIGRIPPNTGDSDYISGVAVGGTQGGISGTPGSSGTNGGNGLVVIEFLRS